MVDQPDRTISEHDQMLAAAALADLERNRLEVAYVPAKDGNGKKRAAVNSNPNWYRAFLDRRRVFRRRGTRVYPKKKPRSSGRRQHVVLALTRIMENKPNPQGRWIGWELLELLHEYEHEIGR